MSNARDRLYGMVNVYKLMSGINEAQGDSYAAGVYRMVAEDIEEVLDGEEF